MYHANSKAEKKGLHAQKQSKVWKHSSDISQLDC